MKWATNGPDLPGTGEKKSLACLEAGSGGSDAEPESEGTFVHQWRVPEGAPGLLQSEKCNDRVFIFTPRVRLLGSFIYFWAFA